MNLDAFASNGEKDTTRAAADFWYRTTTVPGEFAIEWCIEQIDIAPYAPSWYLAEIRQESMADGMVGRMVEADARFG